MGTDSQPPDSGPLSRPRSPDVAGGSERKRRRKVLSCWDCRRRKLQCDRAMPACSRCTKAGQAASCLYLDDSADVPSRESDAHDTQPTDSRAPYYGQSSRPIVAAAPMPQLPPSGDLLSRLEFQDVRIKQLEAALSHASNGTVQRSKGSIIPPTPESLVGTVEAHAAAPGRETTLLRGNSFKTHFHGNTHPGALIAHLPGLHSFTKEALKQYPALQKIREDMRALDCGTEHAGGTAAIITDASLRALLPTRFEADQLVQLYLDSYGSLYHILHLPTFWKDYNEIYADTLKANAHAVAIVLLMMAAAQCLATAQPWVHSVNSSAGREKAVRTIHAVDTWLMSQSQKHVTAADFQIRVLLSLSKQVSARKFKRSWSDLGSTLRFCMAAGLHRSPELIGKPTTVLDKELRQRVWAAVTELELQAAFDWGMVSAPWILQADCPPPSHISDEDIEQSTSHLPPVKRANDFTSISYLSRACETTRLRISINTYLNNIRQPISFEDTKRFTDEIQTHLSEIPDWTGSRSAIPQAKLSLNLRQYLLVLHDRHYRSAETKSERDFSRMILLETATKVLETHKSLASKGSFALELLCTDHLRAGLSLCHITASLDPHADDALSATIQEATYRLVPKAVEMLHDKVIRLGREQRQLWILLAAQGFMKSKADPSNRQRYMQEAVDQITRPFYKIMACQEDAAPAVAGAPAGIETPRAGSAIFGTPALNANGQLVDEQGAPPGGFDPALLNVDELAAWTFEDWSFDPFSADFAVPFPAAEGYAPPPGG